MGIRATQWTNTKWNTENSDRISAIDVFIPKVSTRPMGMDLLRASWVKLTRLCSGVGHFCSSMLKGGLATSSNWKCGATEQTADDHIISQCSIHLAPEKISGLMVLDDKTRCLLNTLNI